MADYIRSEEETIEQIKEWIAKNGLATLIVIVLVVAGMIGWNAWRNHKQSVAGKASVVYETMMTDLQKGDDAKTKASAESLVKQYPGGTYADFAHLVLAKLAVSSDDLKTAAAQLKPVADKPAADELGFVARTRLARVYLQEGNLDEASKVVSMKFPKAWQGSVMELKGDIALAQHKDKAARDAYTTALDDLQGGADRDRVQMKLDNLKS